MDVMYHKKQQRSTAKNQPERPTALASVSLSYELQLVSLHTVLVALT